jgi:hypothetical protein
MRRLSVRCLVLSGIAWLLAATPSLAANIVHVRIGNHPTFTRVVFELDAPAGYRIEKGVDPNLKELIVTLEAASTPRSVRSGGPEVDLVSVQDGAVTVAHHPPAARTQAKELIRAIPRIVIDLMREPSLIAAEKAAARSARARRLRRPPRRLPQTAKPEDGRADPAEAKAEAKAPSRRSPPSCCRAEAPARSPAARRGEAARSRSRRPLAETKPPASQPRSSKKPPERPGAEGRAKEAAGWLRRDEAGAAVAMPPPTAKPETRRRRYRGGRAGAPRR